MTRVKIDALGGFDSPRIEGVEEEHVRVLTEAVDRLPPILVHLGSMKVIDGMHRLAAARRRGLSDIEVRFFRGSAADAFRLAVKANVTHGLPLSLADRRAAATRIIQSHPNLSDSAIAQSAGLSPGTVATLRGAMPGRLEAAERIGVDGRVRPLRSAAGRLAASRAIERRPEASLREIAREAGISLGTARDVRLRLLAGEDPVPPKQRAAEERARRAERRAGGEGCEADLEQAFDALCRDPSLRYSESGRTLLRWLKAREVRVGQWPDSMGAMPSHCLGRVASIAREYARAWILLAETLDGAVELPEGGSSGAV